VKTTEIIYSVDLIDYKDYITVTFYIQSLYMNVYLTY